MFEIGKTFRFSAKHHLPGVAEGHKCREEHGHNYVVTLVLRDEFLTAEGWVQDYGDLGDFKDYLDAVFDHHNVNDTVYYGTAEAIAEHLFNQADALYGGRLWSITVKETDDTYATFTR